MARDYKNRTQGQASRRKAAPRPSRPPWKWGLGGFALGLVVAMGAYVEGRYPGTFVTVDDGGPALPDGGPAVVDSVVDAPARPRFEFYTLLPVAEVEVAEEPAPLRKPKAAPKVEAVAGEAAVSEAAVREAGAGTVATAAEASALIASAATGREPGVKSYMLQVGSFRELSDADRLRATLTLSGHEALIQTISRGDSDTWHRVRLGPFGNLATAERTRAALARDQVDAMVLRIRS